MAPRSARAEGGVMSEPTPDEAPGLALFVTTEQRERAEGVLAEAYADGRLTEAEFDQRLDQVLSARTRRELNTAFYGLIEAPTPGPVTPEGRGRAIAALTHLSGLGTLVLGPAAVFALSSKGSYVRQEAMKAFWFQLAAIIAYLTVAWADLNLVVPGLGMLGAGGRNIWIEGTFGVLWVVLTWTGAINAATGNRWRENLQRAVTATRQAVDPDTRMQPKTSGG
ncbi:hypothetical protein CGZ96_17180 [Enemella evansiae]|nr:hypothetical protein CGZ96_17180 [Enemella evansiae]